MKELEFHRDNLLDHEVAAFEAAEAMEDGWARRRSIGENFEILGRTGEGRYLQIIAREYPDHIWVFHGRAMELSERRRYNRERKI